MSEPRISAPIGPKYRPEVDGLRALAILPVVLFHYRVPGFGGGFVGVDVFFVISGYLITSLITEEMDAGRFSIIRFYDRRVRRIFPALFAMLAAATVAAFLLFFPADLVRYARSLFATSLFAANFEFWREAGYFDVFADTKPLLHLWSIAVEEQFYLLFPALLFALSRLSRRGRIVGIGMVLVASLLFGVWCVSRDEAAAFYLLPARAWELMSGALLAFGAFPRFQNRLTRQLFGSGGIALVAYSVVSFRSDMPFPGLAAILPCMGSMLVIQCADARESGIGRLLAARPLVFVGLISYSLYLWHWPLYVFAKYVVYRDLTALERVALIALSFALAALSWRYVEQPFRKSWKTATRWRLFPAAATAMAVTAAAGVFAKTSDGMPQRLAPDLQRILAEEEDHEPRIDRCFALTAEDVRAGNMCAIGAKAPPSFLLWGDSHADAILPAVEEAARRAGRGGLFAGGASCAPLLGVSERLADCRTFNDAVAALASRKEITEVILAARWGKYAEGASYGEEPRGHVGISDDFSGDVSSGDNHAVFARGLERSIRVLTQTGKKIVVVADVPEIGWPVPAVLARRTLARAQTNIGPELATYERRQKFVLDSFARMQKLYGVAIVYPHRVLCAQGRCEVALNGIPLYRDEHHLSVYGARQLVSLMDSIF